MTDAAPRARHCRIDPARFDTSWRERFWERVTKGAAGECWDWTGAGVPGDYGRFRGPGRTMHHASRLAWALANERDPGALVVRHKCDRPSCCNPAHLETGTHADNAQDKIARGRGRTGDQRGEKNGAALLTTAQVGEIVALFRAGLNNQQIAWRFPVTDSLISRIRTGRSWQREASSFGWEPQRLIRHRAPMAQQAATSCSQSTS